MEQAFIICNFLPEWNDEIWLLLTWKEFCFKDIPSSVSFSARSHDEV